MNSGVSNTSPERLLYYGKPYFPEAFSNLILNEKTESIKFINRH